MFKLFIGFLTGLFSGFLLGKVLPIEFFYIAGMILVVLVILLFFVFHLGLREFQEY